MKKKIKLMFEKLGLIVLFKSNYTNNTNSTLERIQDLENQLKSYKNAFYEIENKNNSEAIIERNYQLLMIHQNIMAEFKDLDPNFEPIYQKVAPYTMTSIERLYDLYKSIEYIVKAKIPGDIIECGVWKGGSMMLVAETLIYFGDMKRNLYCLDTYEGHPKPNEILDVDIWGNKAINDFNKHKLSDEASNWGNISIDEVQINLNKTGYPQNKIILVKGLVENTAMELSSKKFSLVRLDTDWYQSTKTALEVFWPNISNHGILIVDDYGHYKGQRIAVDEYFSGSPILLHRVDYSSRNILKTY